MEQFIYHPFLSTVLSILLIFGCYEVGRLLIIKFSYKETLKLFSVVEFQYATFGIVFMLIILFPLTAFFSEAKIILQISAIILIIFSFNFLRNLFSLSKKVQFFKKKDLFYNLFIVYILLYFILSLSPLTSADVLDYHSGTALNILRLGKYILMPEWFTGMQAGVGEILIALGFSVGAEQFGSLVQFCSILTIAGIFLKFGENSNLFSSKYFFILTIFSCPILVFLLSGNKPQIFYSSLIFLAFSMNFVNFKGRKEYTKSYIIINLFICCAVLGKFSFSLPGFLVWAYSTINFLTKTKNFKLLVIPLIIFVLIYCPFIFWKYINLGGNIINYILSPFPLHLPGYETFLNHNKGSQEIPFPNFLIYTTFSRFTEFLAANTIIFFVLLFYCFKKKIGVILILSIIWLFFSNLYASPSARYYLDIILWMSLGILILDKVKFVKIFQLIFLPQIFLVLCVLIYSIYIFLPGAFLKDQYIKVKHNYAYMFSGLEWVNRNIPKNSKVIIMNRPISSYKSFAVSGNFNYFTTPIESEYYKKLIKNYDIDYLIYLGSKPDLKHLKNCVSGIFKKKNNVGFFATRNPFNKGSSYNAYIYNFDNDKLPDC